MKLKKKSSVPRRITVNVLGRAKRKSALLFASAMILCVAFACTQMTLVFVAKQVSQTVPSKALQLLWKQRGSTQNHVTTKMLDLSYASMVLQYPELGSSLLNVELHQELDAVVEDFLGAVDTTISLADPPAVFSLESRVTFFEDRFASVRYRVHQKRSSAQAESTTLQTRFYHLAQQREVPIPQLFHDEFLSFAAQKLTEEQSDLTEQNTTLDWSDFGPVFFDDDKTISVYPNNSTVTATEVVPLLQCTIEEVLPYLTGDFASYYNGIIEQQKQLENELLAPPLIEGTPMIALTYDDGPNHQVTEKILDALEQVGGRATFFVVGERLSANKATLRRTHDLGSQIASHGYDHTDFTKLSVEQMLLQLSKTADLVENIVGMRPTMFRPPYGAINEQVQAIVKYPLILWSVDTMDWKSREKDAVIARTLDNVKDGDIVLMHDLYDSTGEASAKIILELAEQGYQLVTVEELLTSRYGALKDGKVYYNGQ